MTLSNVSRYFSTIHYENQPLDIHYRSVGDVKNTPVILLHPSPLSSNFMMPLANAFSMTKAHYVIAWDAPGYGDSTHPSHTSQSLGLYIDCLALFMESLNISQAILYGNATGAQIAIEFSKKYPDKAIKLILENVALFTDTERTHLLNNYFPDLTPSNDGRHIETTWKIVNNLFRYFPWFDESVEAELGIPLPPIEVLQATYNDYLKAGSNYADAYIAAINNEKESQLTSINVMTDIVVWQDSIIYKYCERLQKINLPKLITLHSVGSGIEQRMATLVSLLISE